jgi:hypothetical protein
MIWSLLATNFSPTLHWFRTAHGAELKPIEIQLDMLNIINYHHVL